MKLVIDIPDELYNDITDHRIFAPNGVYSCIENGTPVKTGKWIDLDDMVEVYDNWYECSVCGKESFDYNFCPNCGTRMEISASEAGCYLGEQFSQALIKGMEDGERGKKDDI